MARKPRTPRERSIAETMRKFKRRMLHSGRGGKGGEHGPIVQRRRQAIAIALSIAARKYGPYVPKSTKVITRD